MEGFQKLFLVCIMFSLMVGCFFSEPAAGLQDGARKELASLRVTNPGTGAVKSAVRHQDGADAGPEGPSLFVGPLEAVPGSVIDLHIEGFESGEAISLVIYYGLTQEVVDEVHFQADGDGCGTIYFHTPEQIRPGTYYVQVMGTHAMALGGFILAEHSN